MAGAPGTLELPPELASRFRLTRFLGRGGMGVVVAAEDRELARPVAIKLMQRTDVPLDLARFAREAKVMAKVDRPDVIRVYDAGTAGETPYIVMELLEGNPLDDPPPGLDLDRVARAVAEALDALHAEGIVHRDIKPSNLFHTTAGRVVVMDLGLVQDAREQKLTATGVVLGTLAFMAPEVLRTQGGDAAVDWWALGVALYVLAEGRIPFARHQVFAVARGQPVPRVRFDRISPKAPMAQLIRGLLREEPAVRIRGGAAVREVLAAAQGTPTLLEPSRGLRLDPATADMVTPAAFDPLAGEVAAPPSPPAPGPRVAAALALLAAAWLLFPGAGPPPSPAPPPPPTGVPPGSPARFAAVRAELDRVGRALSAAQGEWMTPAGERRALGEGATRPDDWVPFLTDDPARWGDIVRGLDARGPLRAWWAAGGSPREMPAELRAEFAALAARFEDERLPSPFFPDLDLARPPGGWLPWADARLAEAKVFHEAFEDELEAVATGRPTRLEFPAAVRNSLYVPANARSFMTQFYVNPAIRPDLVRMTREGTDLLHRAVVGFFHAAREEPAAMATRLNRRITALRSVHGLWYSALGSLEVRDLAPRPPTTALEHLVAAVFLERTTPARREASHPRWQETRLAAVRAYLDAAAAGEREGLRAAVFNADDFGWALVQDIDLEAVFHLAWSRRGPSLVASAPGDVAPEVPLSVLDLLVHHPAPPGWDPGKILAWAEDHGRGIGGKGKARFLAAREAVRARTEGR